jgi:DNA-binding XRE family transcriptional regulator
MITQIAILTGSRITGTLTAMTGDLPNRLREIRERLDLTQAQLAARLNGWGQQDVQRFETTDYLTIKKLRQLAQSLRCAEQDIIGPPKYASFFAESQGVGTCKASDIDIVLLQRCLMHVDEMTKNDNRATNLHAYYATAIYALAARDAREDGLDTKSIDLSRYDVIFQAPFAAE